MLVCMLELHACAILTSCTVTVLVVDQVLCFMLATSVSLDTTFDQTYERSTDGSHLLSLQQQLELILLSRQ